MSILNTIASDLGSVLNDPGKLVTDVVDALLPEKMKAIGDVAGGVVDVFVGKESKAIEHFQDGLRDLPQLVGTLVQATPDDTVTSIAPEVEASPPPAAADTSPPDGAADPAADPGTLASLLALPSEQFMKAISTGAVPADVAENPAALLQIQARVNDIAQMNQLVTSMMSALHQMQMSIAQNIRA